MIAGLLFVIAVSVLEHFRLAVRRVLEDEGFQLPTEPAKAAVKCAEGFLEWMAENKEMATIFATLLIGKLEGCIYTPKKMSKRSVRRGREKMWESFFKLTASDGFRQGWTLMLQRAKVKPTPIFYQFITDKLMKDLIEEKFILPTAAEPSASPLDYEDCSALRYTAGAVVRSLSKKMARAAHPLKEDIKTCLKEMIEDNVVDGRSFCHSGTSAGI